MHFSVHLRKYNGKPHTGRSMVSMSNFVNEFEHTLFTPFIHILLLTFPTLPQIQSKTRAFRVTYLCSMSVITKINWISINSTEN